MLYEKWVTMTYLEKDMPEAAFKLKKAFGIWSRHLKEARKTVGELRNCQWFVAQRPGSHKYHVFVPTIECYIEHSQDPYEPERSQILINTTLQEPRQLNGLQLQNMAKYFTGLNPDWTFKNPIMANDLTEVSSNAEKLFLLNESLDKKDKLIIRSKSALNQALALGNTCQDTVGKLDETVQVEEKNPMKKLENMVQEFRHSKDISKGTAFSSAQVGKVVSSGSKPGTSGVSRKRKA